VSGSGRPPVRVAIVRARYSGSGGAERFVQRALDALGREGLQLSIVARRWQARQQAADLQWVKLDPFYIGSRWRDASFAAAVRAHLNGHQYDLVQSHERIDGVQLYRAGDGVHAAFLDRRAAFQSSWQRLGVALNSHHRWVLNQERAMFRNPQLKAVICNSRMVHNEIQKYFGVPDNKLHLIRNGLDLNHFKPPDEQLRQKARSEFGLGSNTKVMCFVGSGFERKGLRQAIRACAALNQGGLESMLLVAGQDKARAAYEHIAHALGISDRVRFLGAVEDVRTVLWSSDLMVLPAIYDPFPNAALEALACGVPLVTSDGCGVGELLADNPDAGQVVSAADQSGIDSACGDMLGGQNMGGQRAAARQAVAHLSLEQMAEEMIALYRQLLGQPGEGFNRGKAQVLGHGIVRP
jgi:UDP-glucose:(heptosyl)LPS alpha-1,3-glucosyltransferase